VTANEEIQTALRQAKAEFSHLLAEANGQVKTDAKIEKELGMARAKRDTARRMLSADVGSQLRKLETERVRLETAIGTKTGDARAKIQADLNDIDLRVADAQNELVSEVEASVAETRDEIKAFEAKARTSEGEDRQKTVEAIGKLHVRQATLKEKARAMRETGAARFQQAKAQYDETLAEFADRRAQGNASS
jgi:hypothetical protein